MSWFSGGGLSRLVLGCVAMALAGCSESSIGQPIRIDSHSAAPVVPPQENQGGRGDFGLGDRMALFALADTHSSISPDPSPFRFTDIVDPSGIEFRHCSGMDQQKHYPTAFGSGAAMFDYDGDGLLDLYFATCTLLPLGTARSGPNRLYKNLGGGKFQDVTAASGLGFAGFCHGIIAGDIDNDGDPDVFLCNYGPNALYLNEGNGTFRDISRLAGIDRPNWSSGGAMLDYDRDGDLDIYVANYGDWQYPRDAQPCGTEAIRLYCLPRSIRTVKHILYRNNGDRTFTDVTDEAGLGRSDGHGFSAVAADLNGDGCVDLYVTNDLDPNFVFLNRGDGTFEDATETSGAAYDERGVPQSSMGADAEDCDGDGWPELLVTNFQYEYTAYYQNQSGSISPSTGAQPGAVPSVTFREISAAAGLVSDSMPWVGWGCALADFDNDGWPDCFVANGHIDNNRDQLGSLLEYAEPALLHRNVAAGDAQSHGSGHRTRRFQLSTRDVGPYFSTKHVGRGACFGDLDNDGDIDIVVNHKDSAPAILRNDTPVRNRWIRLTLVGTRSNRDAIGARVDVEAGGRKITRQRKGGCSLQSSNDPRMLIGLGAVDQVDRVTIRWPSGAISSLKHLSSNGSIRVVEPAEEPASVDQAGGRGSVSGR
jgi:hypothetical protein